MKGSGQLSRTAIRREIAVTSWDQSLTIVNDLQEIKRETPALNRLDFKSLEFHQDVLDLADGELDG